VDGEIGEERFRRAASMKNLFYGDQRDKRSPTDQDRKFGSSGNSRQPGLDQAEESLYPKRRPAIEKFVVKLDCPGHLFITVSEAK
jgi:hypothetical protein